MARWPPSQREPRSSPDRRILVNPSLAVEADCVGDLRSNFTAANGDELIAFGDDATFAFSPADGSFEIDPVEFAGGTGRFENATGWYRLHGEDALLGAERFTATGVISSVGSSK